MTSILIVEDEPTQRFTLRALINNQMGYDVVEAEHGQDALDQLEIVSVDVVIMDIDMPVKGGLQTLKELTQLYPNLPVIMLTGSTEIDHAIEAMKLGAIDYLSKPIEPERLSIAIFHALKMQYMSKELERYKRIESAEVLFTDMIGCDGGLMPLMKHASKGAQSDIPILISGETGVGKEVLARALHGESSRAGAPFVAVNCAAIPEQLFESTLFGHEKGAFTGAIGKVLGKFREAEGGTIFLDEVGELRAESQAKLLRVLQEKEVEPVGAGKPVPVNVRIIAATNRDLDAEVKNGFFREDLYFRLNVLPLVIPPLRARKQDIPELINYFIEKFVAHNNLPLREVSTQATALLAAQEWPGNVRELENTIHRVVVLSENNVIDIEEVQELLSAHVTSIEGDALETSLSNPTVNLINNNGKLVTLDALEKRAIEFALYYNQSNMTKTAKSLGMAKPTLYRRLSEYKLDAA